MEARPCVDVAINVLGKPYQTAVTLFTLLERSGAWIDRIHVNLERGGQEAEHALWMAPLADRLVVHRPRFALGTRPVHARWPYRWKAYRYAVRYQRAWERTDKRWLFITHNDMRFHGDLLDGMLAQAEGHIAVGPVGQCWNCPARAAEVCGPERFMAYRPSPEEWQAIMQRHPGVRQAHYPRLRKGEAPWPLPECRVNEWAVLVDLAIARPATMPLGPAVPLGAFHGLDIGTAWFRDVLRAGHTVKHFDIAPYAQHAWASSTGSGHLAMTDRAEYERSEARAHAVWKERFG
ncbi:MAG TPA: hypothetical protein VHL57_06790 [Flavobacteriales bacterium]|jgi:hypothetical protein|nr:hypothetical protein [Flavobacteriales bacterium]